MLSFDLVKIFHFQKELAIALRDYVGRESPLYFAQRLTDHYKNSKGEGPEIYLKREDLMHGGAHKINNAIAQAMLAKRMGRNSIITATGAGQHGVATAAACAKLSLECAVFMGTADVERQASNVLLMKHLGAQVLKKCIKRYKKSSTNPLSYIPKIHMLQKCRLTLLKGASRMQCQKQSGIG